MKFNSGSKLEELKKFEDWMISQGALTAEQINFNH